MGLTSGFPADAGASAASDASGTPNAPAASATTIRPRLTARRGLALGALAAAIVALAVFGLRAHSAGARPAPPLPAAPLVGHPVTLAQLSGKPAFVVFWASWCGPCNKEAPAIESFARQVAGRARVVGVDWDDASGDGVRFARAHGWTFSSMSDPQGVAGARYGLTDLPTTFVIDARGRIVESLVGDQTVASLRAALARR